MICAWCKKTVPGEVFESVYGKSHGICMPCAQGMLNDIGEDTNTFINSLNNPVALVDANSRILHINTAAETMLQKQSTNIKNQLGGEVFGCIYSSLPGGCGRTIHCKSCTIRNTVENTRNTGEANIRIPATLKHNLDNDIPPTELLISTWLVDDVVMLMIEDAE